MKMYLCIYVDKQFFATVNTPYQAAVKIKSIEQENAIIYVYRLFFNTSGGIVRRIPYWIIDRTNGKDKMVYRPL